VIVGSYFLKREHNGIFAPDAGEIERIQVERGGGDIDTSGGPDRLIIK